MLRKLGSALIFSVLGPVIYVIDRFAERKEILATPVFLMVVVMFIVGFAFADLFISRDKIFRRIVVFVATSILAGVAYGAIQDAWPAEISAPEVMHPRLWPVFQEIKHRDFPKLKMRIHQLIINGETRHASTVWWDGEFIALGNIVKYSEISGRIEMREVIWNLKKKDGPFTNFKEANRLRISEGRSSDVPSSCRKTAIVGVVVNGEMEASRAFCAD